jgi:hypothetical protein
MIATDDVDVRPTYAAFRDRARLLVAQDANARLELAGLLLEMCRLVGEERTAADVALSPAVVRRMLRVHRFWGDVRIAPDPGRPWVRASYYLYDRVALDPLLTDEVKVEIRTLAEEGVEVVTRALRAERARVLRSIEEVTTSPEVTHRLTVNQVVNALTVALEHLEELDDLSTNEFTDVSVLVNKVIARLATSHGRTT